MPRERGYYSQGDESPGFGDKAAGIAKIAAIISVAALARRPLTRAAGSLFSGAVRRTNVDSTSAFGRFAPRTLTRAAENLFSAEGETLIGGLAQIRRATLGVELHTNRFEQAIRGLEQYVHPDDLNIFRGDEARERLVAQLRHVVQSRSAGEAETRLLTPEAVHQFNQRVGVRFTFENTTAQANFFRENLSEAAQLRASASMMEDAFISGAQAQHNRGQVVGVLRGAVDRIRGRSSTMEKVINANGDFVELTYGQLRKGTRVQAHGREVDVHKASDRFFGQIGVGTETEGGSVLERQLERFEEAKRAMFDPHRRGQVSGPVELDELFYKSRSGLAIDRQGNMVSLELVRARKDRLLAQGLEDVSLPIFPWIMNVPAKVFGFLNASKREVIGLGRLSAQQEVRRMGVASHLSDLSEGVGIDGKILSVGHDTSGKVRLDTLEGQFQFLSHKDAPIVAKRARVRGVQGPVDRGSWLRTIMGGDETTHTRMNELLYTNAHRISNLSHEAGIGFSIAPKTDAYAPVVRRLYGTGQNVATSDIHPIQLLEFMQSERAASLSSEEFSQAWTKLMSEAGQIPGDHSASLKAMGQAFIGGDIAMGEHLSPAFREGVVNMARQAMDPVEMLRVADKAGMYDPSALNSLAHSDFYRAMTGIVSDPGSLGRVTTEAEGMLPKLLEKVRGTSDTSFQGIHSVQEGLLSEVGRASAIGNVEGGLRGSSLHESMIDLYTAMQDGVEDLSAHPVYGLLRSKGLSSQNVHTFLSESIYPTMVDGRPSMGVTAEGLGAVGAIGADLNAIVPKGVDASARAKIFSGISKDLSVLRGIAPDAARARMGELAQSAGTADVISKRFAFGKKVWYPPSKALDMTTGTSWSAIPSNGPGITDLINDPLGSIKQTVSTGGGLHDFVRGIGDNTAPEGRLGSVLGILAGAPNTLGAEMGIGLSQWDRQTVSSTLRAFLLKRVLPAYVGYESYKNINANAHEVGLPGADDIAANFLSNFNLMGAGIKDTLGITALNQKLVDTLPGLDQLVTPRTKAEYRDYLAHGEEAVRFNRGWLFGSKDPISGKGVKFFRPNFYRRWKSHWTEAENVGIADPEFSWVPSFFHPGSFFKRLFNPDWWQKKHGADRPYLTKGHIEALQSDREGMRDHEGVVYNTNLVEGGVGSPELRAGGGLPSTVRIGEGLGRGSGGSGLAGGSGGLKAGDMVEMSAEHVPLLNSIDKGGFRQVIAEYAEAVRSHTGLFGAAMQAIPGWPKRRYEVDIQDPAKAHSFARSMWMGEYGEALGPLGEFYRRFIHPQIQGLDAYNPVKNSMPGWLPSRFQVGDPMMRTMGPGEMQLPGEAYENLNPQTRPLKARASSLGKSENEMVKEWIDPVGSPMGEWLEDIVSFGTDAHLAVQKRLRERGLLVGSEIEVYDKERNISGHIDAILKGENGLIVADIKTQGQKRWGEVPEKYKDQLNFYMNITGIHQGLLAFVNRDDPTQTRMVDVAYEPERLEAVFTKVERARETVHGMVARGELSPYETMDVVSRLEVLAGVAPNSREYRETLKATENSGLGPEEALRVQRAMFKADRLRDVYNLYPKRYGANTETRDLEVLAITEKGDIMTDMGALRLAGLNFNPESGQGSPEEVLSKYGVVAGSKTPVTLLEGQFNPEVMNDITSSAILGKVNRDLIADGYASADRVDRGPLASKVLHGNSLSGALWEWIAHRDGMIQNKFLRVRTPLEQFKRGEVYGTDRTSWQHLYSNFIEPTISSFVSKDPITAGLQSGIVASLFFTQRVSKIRAFKVAAIAGAGLAAVRGVGELLTGKPWKPSKNKKQSEFDEFWDIIKYTKWKAVEKAAKERYKLDTNVDLDEVLESENRTKRDTTIDASEAIYARRNAARTMYGYDTENGSFQDALATLPHRQRQIAEEIVQTGSIDEKKQFYELLADPQKRIMGRFLGQKSKAPTAPALEEYFKNHFLPGEDWKGWQPGVRVEDLRTRAADLENTRIEMPSRSKIDKARAYSKDVSIPRMRNRTAGNIRSQLERLIGTNQPGIQADFTIRRTEDSTVNVNVSIAEDQTSELENEVQRDLRRA